MSNVYQVKREQPKKGAITVKEAADALGVHHTTVRRHIDKGDINAFRLGLTWRIPTEEVIRIKYGQ
jgi:excisionase family DNA binding protein